MTSLHQRSIVLAICLIISVLAGHSFIAAQTHDNRIRKVLFIGDSMTGWLSERLNAYGVENGFEVATVVWDGSTIRKWGNSPKLKSLIESHDPDAVFISLGLNELLEPNPQRQLGSAVDNIITAVGSRPMVWIGPLSWPGKGKGDRLTSWLAAKLGASKYFDSSSLIIQRQGKTNPHPTRQGASLWTDNIVNWLRTNPSLRFPSLDKPTGQQMLRGKSFTYRRMKDPL